MNDNRTLMGRSLSHLAREISTPKCDLTPIAVKTKMIYIPGPDEERCRCDIIIELLSIRKKSLFLENFADYENTLMLDFLCTT